MRKIWDSSSAKKRTTSRNRDGTRRAQAAPRRRSRSPGASSTAWGYRDGQLPATGTPALDVDVDLVATGVAHRPPTPPDEPGEMRTPPPTCTPGAYWPFFIRPVIPIIDPSCALISRHHFLRPVHAQVHAFFDFQAGRRILHSRPGCEHHPLGAPRHVHAHRVLRHGLLFLCRRQGARDGDGDGQNGRGSHTDHSRRYAARIQPATVWR